MFEKHAKIKKERSFHNGCITCSRNSKLDNRRRQLRTVLSEFQKDTSIKF